jgi:heme-degrading monooxygenase HmoA
MILQIIKLKSNLPEEELLNKAREREPQFKAIPGLIQKYYVKTGQPGQYGGIYVWDSPESLQSYRESDLAKSIPETYEIVEAPNIEIMDILFQLRNE